MGAKSVQKSDITQTDNIRSITSGSNIPIDNLLTYTTPPTILNGGDLVYRDWVYAQVGDTPVRITITAGSAWPYNIPVASFATITSLRPNVRQVIPGASATQDTNEGANQLCRYNFTNSSKNVLASIDVLTTTANGTTVDVDTYIVISE